MTLQEAIETVLKEHNRPLLPKVIAAHINAQGYYSRSDRDSVQSNNILTRVKDYPSLFQNINGYIILVENEIWKNLLTSYWYLVESLRGVYIVADIQFVIAVLLFYKRLVDINRRPGRGYPLDLDRGFDSLLDSFIDEGNSFPEELKLLEKYNLAPQGVFEECARLLEKLNGYKKHEIWSILRQIDTQKLNDKEFGNIFDYFLTLESLNNYKSSINQTPYSLRELMVEILNPKKGSSVFDPVAGTGGLLIDAFFHSENSQIEISGSEINTRIAQLGSMNVIMHGIQNVRIDAKDCFEEVNNTKSFNYIIADLPANGITNSIEHFMLSSYFDIQLQKNGKSFGSLVLLAYAKLKYQGKAILTVSDSFLVKKGKEKEIRDYLIQKDAVESIISLPYGTLRPYTDAKASILVLNTNKPGYLSNRIKFITAKSLIQNSKSLILNNEQIVRAYKSDEVLSKDSQIVNINELRSDSSLSAEAYTAEYVLANLMLKEGSGKLLADLVEIRSGVQPSKIDVLDDGDLPLIKIENLSKNILDLNLTKEITNKVIITPRYSKSIIDIECILIARIGESLKPSIFRPSNQIPAIIPHSNIYALIPKKEVGINLEYLYYQLHTLFVQEQIDKRRLGAVMPYTSIPSLRQIVIPYIKLDAQISSVESQKANLIAEERKRVEERIKAMGFKEEVKQTESDVIKTLTHQLRPTFLGLNNIVNRIERIVDKQNIGDVKEHDLAELTNMIDPEISAFTAFPDNYSLNELLKKLNGDSKHLSTILGNVDKLMNFKLAPEDFKQVDILQFLKNYKQQKDIEINNKYSIIIKGTRTTALIHEGAFKELLDQLLLNAENHGFKNDSGGKIYKIQFTVKYDKKRDVVSIEYSNDGEPFRLTQKDFITVFEKGKRSLGSGIGGNYIYRVIEAHNGKITIAENYEKGFLLTIELPRQQNQEYE